MLPLREAVADGPDASADAIAGVHHGHVGAHGGQIARGGEAREAGAGDQDGCASKS